MNIFTCSYCLFCPAARYPEVGSADSWKYTTSLPLTVPGTLLVAGVRSGRRRRRPSDADDHRDRRQQGGLRCQTRRIADRHVL